MLVSKNLATPQNILITGASSGIGEALAYHYARENNILYLCGRDETRLRHVARICVNKGAHVNTKLLDVSNQSEMRNWISSLKRLDLVIANAGVSIGGMSPTSFEYEEASRHIFDVNLNGVLNTIHPAIDIMRHQDNYPQVAIVSSLAGYRGLPTSPAYSASKAAVKAYAEALTPSMRSLGIHVSTIFPGFVQSRITDKNNFKMPFLMPAENAAKIIASGIEKRKTTIAFPFSMRFLVWILRTLPSAFAIKILYSEKNQKA